jgi:hypothetical protein
MGSRAFSARRAATWLAAAWLLLASTGCLKRMALETQIEAARDARRAVATLQDYEIAREVTLSGLGQLEMLHYLDADNEDALMLLLQSWTGAASGFIEDDFEAALDAGQGETAEYHRRRAQAAYARALHYGLLLLEQRTTGFAAARGNADQLEAWLDVECHDEASAELLLWLGQAWLGRVSMSRDEPAVVAERYVGVAFLERSRALDPEFFFGLAGTILAGYHTATGDLARGRAELEQLRPQHEGHFLPWRLVEARIHCAAGDETAWRTELEAIVTAGDPLPEARLQNVIAMRRARRYLTGNRWRTECGFSPPE